MLNLNRAMIIGNATRDAELRYTPNGQAVAHFAVPTNRRWTNRETGEAQEQVEFHEIVAWAKLGEIANQLIKKGTKVYVEGRLQTHSWETPDGQRRQRTEIVAENIIALSPRGETSYDSTSAAPVSPPASSAKSDSEPAAEASPKSDPSQKDAKDKDSEEINLDDIPF